MSDFFKTWLNLWCVVVAVFGLVLAGGGLPATDLGVELVFRIIGGPGELEWTPHLRFGVGLMGAVTVGWAITFYAAFQAAFQLRGAAAALVWKWIMVGVAVWYIVDGVISVATGFWMNVISNTLLLVLFLMPLLASRSLSPSVAGTP